MSFGQIDWNLPFQVITNDPYGRAFFQEGSYYKDDGSIWTGVAFNTVDNFIKIPSLAWEQLPPAASYPSQQVWIHNHFNGFMAYSRNVGGTFKWRPTNKITLLSYVNYSNLTFGPNNPAVEYVLSGNKSLPSGLLQIGDNIVLDALLVRGGTLATTNGSLVRVRFGTSDTPASNTVMIGTNISGGTNTVQSSIARAGTISATESKQYTPVGIGVAVSTTAIVTNTITDITTANLKLALTILAGGTAETLTPVFVNCYLEPSG